MSDDNFALFVGRVNLLIKYQREWITEYGCRFLKGNAMFVSIPPRFIWIPLEFDCHDAISRCMHRFQCAANIPFHSPNWLFRRRM